MQLIWHFISEVFHLKIHNPSLIMQNTFNKSHLRDFLESTDKYVSKSWKKKKKRKQRKKEKKDKLEHVSPPAKTEPLISVSSAPSTESQPSVC